MREPFHPTADTFSLPRVLAALSDPARLSLVQSLAYKGEQTCGPLAAHMAKSTASHHFRVLREAGLIQMVSEGKQFINSLRKAELDSRFPGLMDAVLQALGPPAGATVASSPAAV